LIQGEAQRHERNGNAITDEAPDVHPGLWREQSLQLKVVPHYHCRLTPNVISGTVNASLVSLICMPRRLADFSGVYSDVSNGKLHILR
jgi:hypothetical protein